MTAVAEYVESPAERVNRLDSMLPEEMSREELHQYVGILQTRAARLLNQLESSRRSNHDAELQHAEIATQIRSEAYLPDGTRVMDRVEFDSESKFVRSRVSFGHGGKNQCWKAVYVPE